MRHALLLAKRGLYSTCPNPRVGCVLVREGAIVGEGWHQQAGEAHAEIMALTAAKSAAKGASCYVTLAPCTHFGKTPPCTEALIAAGVKQVIFASHDPHPEVEGRTIAALEAAGIEVISDVLCEEALALNPGFMKRHQQGYPWVRVKMALSLDGKVALANGESRWLTGALARQDVHYERARSSAILTGINTVLADDPRLNVRLNGDTLPPWPPLTPYYRPPVRIILDSQLKLQPSARLFTVASPIWIYTHSEHKAKMEVLRKKGATLFCQSIETMQNVKALLKDLARKEINEVMVEAGPKLAGAFIAAQVVDELILYYAPKILGPQAKSAFELPLLNTLEAAFLWQLCEHRVLNDDIKLVYRRNAKQDSLRA